ncbi:MULTISPECIES: hypothetical protein [Cyanophyceae]|uniref:hypothetical protein n=1 Tax=Cyanophyceae TaxID=3028117 RepID=UPI0016861285|nr:MULTISPECIES: hypothetical protein [Cyanophyceae]MBD1916131.1 hypothetical protein [Phormidium sp. FACHB-77]MBD2031600.1 hypothetical protein [Phormidium sp. FACHB-322]MBD2052773.1 hypothetical protein [Leptolyngbya sp. FACHB-60]
MGTTQGFIRKVMGLGRRVVALCAIALIFMAGCAKPVEPTELLSEPTPQFNRLTGQIAEVSPPETLETLKQIIDAYTPQVRILSPRPGEVLDDTSVSVRFQVRGLPLFKDDAYELGPHLHLFLDNEPYTAVYDLSEPITFDGLSPGTHTLRVFASRPWHESFKNQGAFDQRTFHIVASTPQNELNAKAPLLTYSRPQATYGAEPIMLDFYLTNAPLHMSAQAEANDDLHDWRIRCTVNDQSFVFDQWQPIWLKGFKPGRNWVQLELIDESGNPIDNRFNNTVRIIDYQPGGSDTLSRLVRGELGLNDVAGIIDPTYIPPAPEPTAETPELEPQPPAADVETPEQNAPEPEITQPDAAPEPSQPETTQEQPEIAPDAQDISPAEPEDETPPTPFLLPEKSIESEAAKEDQVMPEDNGAGEDAEEDALNPDRPAVEAPAAIAPESKDAMEDMVPLADPEIPPVLSPPQAEPEPIPVRPTLPATPEATPEPSSKGLLNRFKQWRNPVNPSPAPAPTIPNTIPEDTFGDLPQVTPVPDALSNPEADVAPELPKVQPKLVEPYTDPSLGEEQTEPSLPSTEKAPEADSPEAETDEPVELPRSEQPNIAPRSPLAPEARPFI